MHVRLASFGSIILIAIFLSQTPAYADSPITGENYQTGDNKPTDVSGFANGELPGSELINVAPNCKAHRSAAPSLGLLLGSARKRGISLGTNECYRPLSEQIAVSQRWTNAGNSACAAAPSTTTSGAPKGMSNHGWGKATDFKLGNRLFQSDGYRYLKAVAGSYGWNHPDWAEPQGRACPEAWHWEWVGDGGTNGASPVRADVIGILPATFDNGYSIVTGLGAVGLHGSAPNYGSATNIPLNWLMVGVASAPDRIGAWMVGADGGVFSFGSARFYGSTGSMPLNQPIVGMTATPSGRGYWLVAADGGVFSFGDAQFFGSTGATRLNKPVVGMASTPTGLGYWLTASDGGIFAFGDAAFYGSTGSMKLNQPVVGATPSPTGQGYMLIASDGGTFAFGDARFYGSLGATPPAQPVVSVTGTLTGNGYWITCANGNVYAYGDARYFGGG